MLYKMVIFLEAFSRIYKEFCIDVVRIHFKNILEAARNFTHGSRIAVRKLPDHTRSTTTVCFIL